MQRLLKNHVFGLIAWVLILLISVIALPNITQLTNDHSNVTLPKSVQSNVAQSIRNDWGKKKKNTYEVAVVFNKKHGQLTAADKANINGTVANLENNKGKYGITDSLTPDSNIATRKKLQSKDGTTWVMQLNISKKHGRIGDVENQIRKAVKTDGLRTYVTGADILQNAFSTSIQEGIKKTEAITVVFIFIVLIIVFRSPIVPLISLLTVGISFLTSFSIVTNLVQHANFPFSNFTQVFMVIVLFGIGTDYNILLYDKFKENLGKGMDHYKAMHDALRNAGKTILYSGSSILIGFTALSLANFSVYQSAVGVAVGVAVLLLVLLTLNPFFMAVLGKRMFWPAKKFEGEREEKLWHGISASTLKHPLIYLIVLAIVVTPFMLMYSGHLNYDDTDEIANNVPAKKGLLVVQKHFSKGLAEPSYLYIRSKHRLDNETNLRLIDQLTKQLQASKDVSFATSVTEPYGSSIKQLYVNNQLGTVNDGLDQVRSGLGKLGKGSQKATKGATRLENGADQLQAGTGRLQSGADQLVSGTSRLQAGAGRLQSGANRLQSGAAQLQAGTGSLISGVGRLQTGAGRLQSGTLSLVSGANRLQNGAGSLRNGGASLAAGTQSLVNGLNQMSAQLSSQMNGSSRAQLAQLQTALPEINSGIQELNQKLQSQGANINTGALTANLNNTSDKIRRVLQNQEIVSQAVEDALRSNSVSNNERPMAQRIAQAAAASALRQAGSQIQGALDSNNGSQSLDDSSNMLNSLNSLKQQVNTLAAVSNRALPGAAAALSQLNSGLSQVQGAVAQGTAGARRLQAGANALSSGAGRLYTGIGSLSNGASALNSGAGQLNAGLGALSSGAGRLNSGAGQLATGLGTLSSGAGQLNSGLAQGAAGASALANGVGQLNTGAGQLSSGAGRLASSMPRITDGLNQANNGLGQGQAYLQGLQNSAAANTFYIPKEFIQNDMFQKSINVYLSPNKKSAMLIVVFNSNPSATQATRRSQELSSMARKSLQGTALKNAKVAMGGQSSKIEDTKKVASGDFIRTAAIMLIGIGIALMFVTRSLLQPIYILGTLLIAYLCSLSINQWIVRGVLGKPMLTWNTPFFGFIMLIALGVDYSIFLMTRYRELRSEGITSPSKRILRACGLIGTVVISAAIILGGTFAALIPSAIPTLIEVALTVDVGLLILVFILPITLSATTKLTYEGLGLHWRRKKDKK